MILTMKATIKINSMNLLCDALRALNKVAKAAKFSINDAGLSVYGKNGFSKCDIVTNSIVSDEPVEFCIPSVQNLIKLLGTAQELHKDDLSKVGMSFSENCLRITSKKMKTRINTCDPDTIKDSVGHANKGVYTPKFEFITTADEIKRINNHTFLFNETGQIRIYLEQKDDMEGNSVFATITDPANELSNTITLQMGLADYGKLDSRIVLDFERLNILNIKGSDEMRIQLLQERPILMSSVSGNEGDSTLSIKVYVFPLAK